jgi:hypothetical protein
MQMPLPNAKQPLRIPRVLSSACSSMQFFHFLPYEHVFRLGISRITQALLTRYYPLGASSSLNLS